MPPLKDQEQAPPRKSAGDEFACGTVYVDGRKIPLLCLDEKNKGKFEKAATPLVTYEEMRQSSFKLPVVVDHREEGTEGAVRDQGESPCCSAFALAGALDHASSRFTGKPSFVSTMQLWGRYHHAVAWDALTSNIEAPIGAESGWPFDAKEASSWMSPKDCSGSAGKGAQCGKPVDQDKLHVVDAHPIVTFLQAESLFEQDKQHPFIDTDEVRAKLAAGQDVFVGLKLGRPWDTPAKKGGVSYVADYAKTTGGHYVLFAGYATLAHGTYFLVKNSWGKAWGDGGYAWLHENTVKQHCYEAYVVDSEPASEADRARRSRARESSACSGKEVPDSITGACAEKCADGSPRHDNVCARAEDCMAGYVNLTGTCVLGAPAGSGSDPRSNVRWACGAAGCAYAIPKGVGVCMDQCEVSCPAPDFRLGKDARGFTCME